MPAAWQVTEARVCEQLAQGWYLNAERPAVEPATVSQVQRPNHHTNSLRLRYTSPQCRVVSAVVIDSSRHCRPTMVVNGIEWGREYLFTVC